jgi:hypothetical protein
MHAKNTATRVSSRVESENTKSGERLEVQELGA